jgi:endonuclease/exonuclease/phosphatase family metal-dependent hydrolase
MARPRTARSRRGGTLVALVVALASSLALGACTGGDDNANGNADDAGRGPSGRFSLLSYNVAGLPQEFSQVNPKEHLPLISPKLEPFDVVLTQEDFDWWRPILDTFDFVNYHARLTADATHEYRSSRHPGPAAAGLDEALRPTQQVGDGLGMLSRFPIVDEKRIAWKGCFGGLDTSDGGAGDCLAMKGFGVATMELAPGVEVDVYNLHGEAGGTAEDQQLQRDDYDELAVYINANSKGRAIILGGDTNLHTDPDHPDAEGDADTKIWRRFLRRTGLRDACTAVGCEETGDIDKIAFRSTPRLTLTPLSHDFPVEDFKAPDGEDLSDHDPLVVELRWQARS